MPKTRGLYIDDIEQERLRGVGRRLKRAFAAEYPHAELELKDLDFDAAEKLLEDKSVQFDLVVVDILEKDNKAGREVRRGWEICELLRGRGAALIAISTVPGELAPHLAHGVSVTLQKGYLFSDDANDMYLRSALVQAFNFARIWPRTARDIELEYDPLNLALQAAVSQVGEDNLRELVARLASATPAKITVELVRPGLSGAVVFNCYCHVPDGLSEQFLLKASRDASRATQELMAWKRRGNPQLPALASQDLADIDGWFGIAIDFQHGETLTDWLAGPECPPSPHDVTQALRQLATGLASQYEKQTGDFPLRAVAAMAESTLTIGRQARIMLALEEMRPLIEHKLPDYVDRLDAIEPFFRHRIVAGVGEEKMPPASTMALAHGDLHGRNLLVHEGGLRLLDPADMVLAHPAMDWARLRVDVLLMGLATSADCHDWGLLDAWLRAAVAVIDERPVAAELDASVLPAPCATALDWLTEEHGVFFKKLQNGSPSKWERQVAVAVEFLRATPRSVILSMPLRVLALAAGVEALERAASTLRSGVR
ncbi:phosphotransferase family protein [Solirubrobacter soli]|uniref:phosphotransferase family protein n=1 Tax=Solirubrobacter soli TaxID=363832 RepID=UPI000414BC25|nr:phosphotransferase [Solirubrobacter soli]